MASTTLSNIVVSADGKTATAAAAPTTLMDLPLTLLDSSKSIIGPMKHAQTALVVAGGMMGESYMRTGSPRIKLLSGG